MVGDLPSVMAIQSPVGGWHESAGAVVAAYGPGVDAPGGPAAVGVVQTYGELGLEYAALRKGCVLIDVPQRATLVMTGAEGVEFLNRMITQEMKGFSAGDVRRGFWLNRKGRIEADLRVLHAGDRLFIDVDVYAAKRALEGLSAYIITEDCAIEDATEAHHRFELHGPTAGVLLGGLGAALPAANAAVRATLFGAEAWVDRWDTTGEAGYHLLVGAGEALRVWEGLVRAGVDEAAEHLGREGGGLARQAAAERRATPGEGGPGQSGLRVAGWHAFNIARIERGTPVYNLDFGPEHLPAESGVLDDRVSFTKGCYLGQEVVARMHSRGQSKRVLVGLRAEDGASEGMRDEIPELAQPETGSRLFVPDAGNAGMPTGEAVGMVTSSTISPLLGAAVVCLGHVKPELRGAGTRLVCETAGGFVGVRVGAGLGAVPTGAA